MISVTTFSPEIETISSSFTKIIHIIDIFYHFFTFEPRICEVWKGKNLCPLGVKSCLCHILCALKSRSFWRDISISLENLQIELVTRRAIADRLEAMSIFKFSVKVSNENSSSERAWTRIPTIKKDIFNPIEVCVDRLFVLLRSSISTRTTLRKFCSQL